MTVTDEQAERNAVRLPHTVPLFQQITCSQNASGQPIIFGLDNRGRVWCKQPSRKWYALPIQAEPQE